MRTVISIPVHESYPCIVNQIENIKKFVPSCVGVVLHVSGDSYDKLYTDLVMLAKTNYPDFLYINPHRYKTFKAGESANVTGLASIWSHNFRYMSSIKEFDFYNMATSNELFVRSGLEDLMEKYSCQYHIWNPPTKNPRLIHPDSNRVEGFDKVLRDKYKCEFPEYGVCEGSFFPFHVWKRVADIVLDDLEPMLNGRPLGLNEYILPTLFFGLFPELYNSVIPETYVFGPKDYEPNALYVPENIVRDVKEGKHPYQFIVKRVPRIIDHPIRKFINSLV